MFETTHASLVGNRNNNQDRCALLESADTVLLVVADGMGGHPKGEEAAQLVVDTCEDAFMRTKKPIVDPERFLEHIARQAHEAIITFGYRHIPAIDPRTTVVLCLVQNGLAHWGHVGDSRLYHIRGTHVVGKTIDHSYVERLREQGIINEAEKENHPFRNYVTRCLGGSPTPPELTLSPRPARLEKGDILLLCTDGLWGPLGDERIATGLDSAERLSSLLMRMADMAVDEASPSSDNVTGVALRWLFPAIGQATTTAPVAPEAEKSDKLTQAIDDLKTALEIFDARTRQD
ncbi:MAG: protein phosphatase 2C domain-containing protein [Gammaproteobacteria bacterium]|nr:protein phosphatase 2C domain-containing protein [Gammaproteobacteria bacterium]MBU1653658.1 protein phosphatase 2C domain-containing protein [Gammaproteobacteria bacterium]MBU1962488.1 protein phosphatase 2C domain-containing protein [Gammaproteobacteria bacterium]